MIPRDTFGLAVLSAPPTWSAIALGVSGLVLGSLPQPLWWGMGGLMVLVGLVLLGRGVVRAYRVRRSRGVRAKTLSTRDYIATALALAVPPLLGLVLGMDPAFAGLVVAPLVLWGGYGGVLGFPVWIQGASFVSGMAVLLGILIAFGDVIAGLSLAGQAAIVAFVAIAILAIAVEAIGRAANRPMPVGGSHQSR